MSINHTNKRQKISAKYFIAMAICVLCIFAISFAILWLPKTTVSTKNDGSITNLSKQALISNNGWNQNILNDLSQASFKYGNNVALGNASGVDGVLVSLGGYTWEVVYRQNNILTLYCVDSVYSGSFNAKNAEELQTQIREYLNGPFYNKLISNIGYQNFEDYIVCGGDKQVSYQINGMQNIALNTTDNLEITNNDIIYNDKVWLPSAYEVGGYLLGDNASLNRVNSFNNDSLGANKVSSGLWNLSMFYRQSNNACLRSNTSDGKVVYINKNGVLNGGQSSAKYEIRPAINVCVPQSASINSGSLSSVAKLAISGSGTQSSPYMLSTPQDLIAVSNNVLNGETYSGKYIQLASNIDLSGVTVWTPIGLYNNILGTFAFSGTFDGNGYSIINASSANTGLVGVFGYASGATIKNLAITSTNWTTAGAYAGGLVSVMDNGTTLTACYNNASSVSGGQNVGGLVGAVNVTGNTVCTINDVYNTGAVAGKNNVAGLVGNANYANIARAYNIGTATNSLVGAGSNVNITNAYYTAQQAQSYGTKIDTLQAMRQTETFVGFSFYSAQNLSGIWFKSNYLNNGFPTLKIFVKNTSINLYTTLNDAGDYYFTLSGSTTQRKSAVTTLGTEATFKAELNPGYRFLGWYAVRLSITGKPILNDENATLYNENAIFTQNVTDYLYLEARFIKTYTVGIDTLFADFSTSYTNNDAVTVTYEGTKIDNDYDINSVITITVATNIDELSFKGIAYKTSSASATYNLIGTDVDNVYGYWESVVQNQNNIVYTLKVGDAEAFTTNVFDLQIQFERQFNLTLSLNTIGTNNLPTASVQFGISGNTISVNNNQDASGVFEYSVPNGLLLLVDMTNATVNGVELRSLEDWTFEFGSNTQTINKDASNILISTFIPSNNSTLDSIYNLKLTANFKLNDFTITASTHLYSPQNNNDTLQFSLAKVLVKLDSGAEVSSIDSDVLSVSAPYNTLASICFIPNYQYGYKLFKLTINNEEVNVSTNANNIYYYNFNIPTQNVNAVIEIEYININITPVVAVLNGAQYTTLNEGITFTPANYQNVTYYNNIDQTTITLDTTDNFNMCYGLRSVDVSFDNGSNFTTIINYNDLVAEESYTLFNQDTLVKYLYQQANNTILTLTNNQVTLRVVLYPVNIMLTVVPCYSGTTNIVSSAEISVSTQNQINANNSNNVYSYVLGSSVTVSATALDYGHRLLGFSTVASANSGFLGTVAEGYKNSGSYILTLNTNTTLYAYFELRNFTISFVSDANTLASGSSTFATQGITARDNSQSTNLNLNFDTSSNTTSTITLPYGRTLIFSATQRITVNSKDLILVGLDVLDATTNQKISNNYKVTEDPQSIVLTATESGEVHTSIKIVFTYNFVQRVYLKIDSSVADADIQANILNGSLQFKNKETNDIETLKLSQEVVNTAKTSAQGYPIELFADADGTDYTLTFLINITQNITMQNQSTGVSSTSNEFDLTLQDGQSVTILIQGITHNNASINISGYFIFG